MMFDVADLAGVRPTRQGVMIQIDPNPEKTEGGIWIPADYQRAPFEGVVLSVGPGFRADDGGPPLEVGLVPGDRILVGKWTTLAGHILAKRVFIVPAEQILAKRVGPGIDGVEPLWGRALVELDDKPDFQTTLELPENAIRRRLPKTGRVLTVGKPGWRQGMAPFTDGVVFTWKRKREPVTIEPGAVVVAPWAGDGRSSFLFDAGRHAILIEPHILAYLDSVEGAAVGAEVERHVAFA